MSIKIFSDQNELVPTSAFPHAKFPFEFFNPVQSRIMEFYHTNENCLVASSTGSGKTITSEIVMSYEIRVNKKKAIYVSPLRSLAQEMYDEWTSEKHHFSDLNISMCTGDYRLTESRIDEINNADIVVITAESLNSRARNQNSKSSQFLKEVGLAVSDEHHAISIPGRGSHIESAVIKLTQLNPNIRFVMLSATLPNVDEVAKWTSVITNKNTNIIQSTYRPVKLNIHFPTYRSIGNSYDDNEESKITRAMQIVDSYPQDKFLIFAHGKRTGESMLKRLRSRNVISEFHNGDLSLQQRLRIESGFQEGNIRILVATSTLAYGRNLPARRVIILGVHRGKSEVETYDILQAVGRSGRPKYDKEGDAYVLVPDLQALRQKERVLKPQNIKSQLTDVGELAFHIVSEIHHRDITTISELESWYLKTFAFAQKGHAGISDCHDAIVRLKVAGCIKVNGNEVDTTPIGAAASMFYFDPFDVSALARNISIIFSLGKKDILDWAFALSCIPSCKLQNPTTAESDELEKWYNNANVRKSHISFSTTPGVNGESRMAFVFHKLMTGDSFFKSSSLNSLARNTKNDFERTSEMLECLDKLSGKWKAGDCWNELRCRVNYGVEAKYAQIIRLPGIGKVKATKLYEAGLTTLDLISSNPESIIKAIRCKPEAADLLAAEARKISLTLGN